VPAIENPEGKGVLGPTKKQIVLFCIIAGAWIYLAGAFVVRTSHVSIDGVRYFTIFDDGMISMRYAKNLVDHHGLVWNIGERVEGFTNPLWTLSMVGAIWAFGTHYAPLAVQMLGAMTCLGLLGVFYWTGVRNQSDTLGLVAGMLVLVLSYPISYWGLGGMEASAVCLVFTAAAGAQYTYEAGNRGNPLILLSMLVAIAYCLRPDGWLAIAPFFAASCIDSVREKNYARPLKGIAIIIAAILLVLVPRKIYYGAWVPNTYVLKVEGYSFLLRVRNGIAFVGLFISQNRLLLFLTALATLSRRRIAFLNFAAVLITLAYQVYVGGDPWIWWRQLLPVYSIVAFSVLVNLDYVRRLFPAIRDSESGSRAAFWTTVAIICLPIVAFEYQIIEGDSYLQGITMFYLLILVLLLVGHEFIERKWGGSRFAPALLHSAAQVLLIIVALGSVIIGNTRFLPELRGKPMSYGPQANLIDKAVLANRLFGPGKTHHMVWAGTYPYYVEGKMIDSLGKSDKAVATYPVDESVSWDGMRGVPGHAKYDYRDTILKREPDIIIDYTGWGTQDLAAEINRRYTLIKSMGVSLCVKNELAAEYPNLESGNCPRNLIN
jgi:hypothetical protein